MDINSISNISKIITKTNGTLSFRKLSDTANDVFVKSSKAIDEGTNYKKL